MTLYPKVRNLLEMAERGELPETLDWPFFGMGGFLIAKGCLTDGGKEKLELERLREKAKKEDTCNTPCMPPMFKNVACGRMTQSECLELGYHAHEDRLHKIEEYLEELTKGSHIVSLTQMLKPFKP